MLEKKRDIKNKTEKKGKHRKGNLRSKKRAMNELVSGLDTTPQNSMPEINQQKHEKLGDSDIPLKPGQPCPRCGQPYRTGTGEINVAAQQRDIPTNWIELVKWLYGKLTGRSKKAATWVIVIAILVYGGYKIWPHIEWRIRDIKFYMTVENTSEKKVGLSETGRFTVYEGYGGENKPLLPDDTFTISCVKPNSAGGDSVVLQPGKTLIQVAFRKTKPVWDVYKNGHAYVDLEFLPANQVPAPESRIPFNAGTLRANEVIRNLVLADDEALWTSSSIKAYFVEPKDRTDTIVAKVIEYLRQGGSERRKLFKIGAAPDDFDIHKKQFAEDKKKRLKDPLGLKVDEEEANQWEREVEVRIEVSRDDSKDRLMVHLEDVQKKINVEFPMVYRSDQDWLSIDRTLELINRTIVSKYPVRGRITEVYGDSTKRYACLNVGSVMGVWEGMKFNVFSPGTNEPISTLTITVVHHGEGASGELGEEKHHGLVKEGFRVESTQE